MKGQTLRHEPPFLSQTEQPKPQIGYAMQTACKSQIPVIIFFMGLLWFIYVPLVVIIMINIIIKAIVQPVIRTILMKSWLSDHPILNLEVICVSSGFQDGYGIHRLPGVKLCVWLRRGCPLDTGGDISRLSQNRGRTQALWRFHSLMVY